MNCFDDVLDKVIVLSGRERTTKLELEVYAVIEQALAYCYRDEIPDNMILPLAQVCANELDLKDIAFGKEISAYKEGDMSVNFGGLSTGVRFGGLLDGFKQIVGLKDV